MSKHWKVLFLLGSLAVVNFIIHFSEYYNELGNKAYFIGIVMFWVGILVYEIDVLLASIVVYFVQALSGKIITFKEIKEAVFSSFYYLILYVIINIILTSGFVSELVFTSGWRKLLYVPIYIASFVCLKKNVKDLIGDSSWANLDTLAGIMVLMLITGV